MPPLPGPARGVVDDAIAGVDLDLAVVARHRHAHDQRPLGVPQQLVQSGVEAQPLGRIVEPVHHRLERFLLVLEPLVAILSEQR